MHIENKEDASDLEEELVDRFGEAPNPVRNLILIAHIKALAARVGVSSISQLHNSLNITFQDETNIKAEQLAPITSLFKNRISFSVTPNFQIIFLTKGIKGSAVLEKLEKLLDKLANEVK
jgi:transcription-repair coupling factor (superfamily II helicase)